MNTQEVIQAESQYILQTYGRAPVVFTQGKGLKLVDADGNEYLDFTSGIAVTALGHSDEEWATAVAAQAHQLTHISNLYHSEPQVRLAQKLVESSFADKVYFCNSGAEANEAAIKFARKYARKEIGDQRLEIGDGLTISNLQSPIAKTKIVAFSGGFHGRTVGALSVTYKEQYRAPFAPLMPDVMFAPFNDLEGARAVIDAQTCAVIVEPVQGEGGVNPATPDFLKGLRQLCDQSGALLIFDEVQCGLGRTGKLWAYQNYSVRPDIMTLAKPLAGGLPMGATLMTQKVADALKPGDHGSTFAAGPLVCTAANVVFDRVNRPEFLEKVRFHGSYLQHRLQTLESDKVTAVRGLGLLVGVELNVPAAPLIAAARERGLILIGAGENVLRFAPALVVDKAEIDTAVDILAQCLE
ncbi:MAG: aspartate aminotransferase family protein [Chloroflexi bacterium]|nr:aspartate aminotransferase family protein [Ardenticatenaceae bacterium]MBL1130537.1 aspartate aminotransferase family protein [Chloroflexota bacterium]NOG36627.1 aspartate aminotransferase family protein [Chloroflexota bacterium]GIK56728.1 MAG: acetylornithine aminotransferase [Chloroflexota bacterium]